MFGVREKQREGAGQMALNRELSYVVRADGRDIAQFLRSKDTWKFVNMKRLEFPDVVYKVFIDGKREEVEIIDF